MDTVTAPSSEPFPLIATIRPWLDPVVDERGFDPRSGYAESCWLGVVGPTALWILRRIARGFDERPDGFVLDLEQTARSMGLSVARGASSPFGRSLQRCVMFGLAQPWSDGFAVRRRLPAVAQRHLSRLPDDVRSTHEAWQRATVRVHLRDLERRLVAAGVPRAAAITASEAAVNPA